MEEIPEERLNVDYLFFNDKKKIYVCLNHRAAYLCWIDAQRRKFLNDYSLLFHIDYHADFWLEKEELLAEQETIKDQLEKLKEFVKHKLRILNTDFIVLSMHRGTIGDAISIHRLGENLYGEFKKGGYIGTDRQEFKDRKSVTHKFYLCSSSIEGLTGYQGLLTDRFTNQDVKQVFEENVRKRNAVLDVDLDFFTYADNEERRWAMNPRNLDRLLYSEGFNYIFDRMNVITIALEPLCCGGNVECLSILDKVSSYICEKINLDIKEETVTKFANELRQ